ncbi:MAG: hypothetical protein MJA31_12510 [Clostridia bacterium]|nr:hypothetical protein [Clostridia bacterium]
MNVNFNQMNGFNQNLNQQKNDPISRIENQIMRIDKQIQSVKENKKLELKVKQEKIKELKQSKEELSVQLQELKIEARMKETEEKMQEAEARKEKDENKPLTPLEEIKAEMGIENAAAESLIKANDAVDNAELNFNVARRLEAESKTLRKAVETDIGRGQAGMSNDYRVEKSAVGSSRAEKAKRAAFRDLGEANQHAKRAGEKVEEAATDKKEVEEKKETEKISEIKGDESTEIKIDQNNIEEVETPKAGENKDAIGENVDALA